MEPDVGGVCFDEFTHKHIHVWLLVTKSTCSRNDFSFAISTTPITEGTVTVHTEEILYLKVHRRQ